ncbi:ABC Superfamily [Phytophthora palmivora]|uniref:ABC Superfamily n=1 Tax=Phytophthora palmivora TaxID=4796 RepID=A0A2P4WYV0_9STRA|nr:ABC Superfamily [Phytophthora palmivora]
MPRTSITHGASAPPESKAVRSKTAKAKSKGKAAPRTEASKTASKTDSKPTAAATQGGSARRGRSRSLSPDDRPNPRFIYRDHISGVEPPDFDIPMITGSESDRTLLHKDPPSQDAPVDDTESSEAKAASTSSPAKKLTLSEAPGPPTSEPSIAKGFKSLFDSSDEDEEEGAVSEPQGISNDLDEQQERYQAAQLQGTPVPPTPVYPRGYYPPDAGSGSPLFLEHLKAPLGVNHGCTSRGAYERALVQVEPLFVNDIEAARRVLLAPHRIPLKKFTSLRKKSEDRGGLSFVWGYPWVQPENTTTQSQAEDLFWRWVSLKNFTVQELKELREDRLLSYVLDQRDLLIDFAPLNR